MKRKSFPPDQIPYHSRRQNSGRQNYWRIGGWVIHSINYYDKKNKSRTLLAKGFSTQPLLAQGIFTQPQQAAGYSKMRDKKYHKNCFFNSSIFIFNNTAGQRGDIGWHHQQRYFGA